MSIANPMQYTRWVVFAGMLALGSAGSTQAQTVKAPPVLTPPPVIEVPLAIELPNPVLKLPAPPTPTPLPRKGIDPTGIADPGKGSPPASDTGIAAPDCSALEIFCAETRCFPLPARFSSGRECLAQCRIESESCVEDLIEKLRGS